MNIVKNNSKGYGYNYASLGDIAKQGYEIPKMKTGSENGREYVFYFDKEIKEWIRGAEIVVPQSKSQNVAQMYASGITYARRVTAQLALGLACADDVEIEQLNGDGSRKPDVEEPKKLEEVEVVRQQIFKRDYKKDISDLLVATNSNVVKFFEFFGVNSIEDLNDEQCKRAISMLERKVKRNA